MKNIAISITVSVLIAGTVFMTGCDSSEPEKAPSLTSSSSVTFTTNPFSSTATNSSSNSSVSIGSTNQIKVSDAYVLSADVRIGGVLATLEVGNGVYEWSPAQEGIISVSKKGVNDLNDNGQVDSADAYAPAMSAPSGHSNVNPFTTLLNQGVSNLELLQNYPNAYSLDSKFDFDAVQAGNNNIEIAKEVLKAALRLAISEQNNATSFRAADCVPLPSLPSNILDGVNYCDPNDPNGAATSSVSSNSSSSMSSNSSNSMSSNSDSSMSSANSSQMNSSSSGSTTGGLSIEVSNSIENTTSVNQLKNIAKAQFDSIYGAVKVSQ